jgi:hypothetical protein
LTVHLQGDPNDGTMPRDVLRALCANAHKFPHLTQLNLGHVEVGAGEACEGIRELVHLTHLTLPAYDPSHHPYYDPAVLELSKRLRPELWALPRLESLNLGCLRWYALEPLFRRPDPPLAEGAPDGMMARLTALDLSKVTCLSDDNLEVRACRCR